MADYTRPLPLVDADTQTFWDSAKAHDLRAQRCASCKRLRWPPQGFCPHCYSWDFTWDTLRQTGRVQSYVVIHQAPPAFANEAPYAVARVVIDDTEERVILTANIIDIEWTQVRVGMRMEVVFDDVTPEVTLPRFRPTASVGPPAPAGA
jgi:uncharacterized OB-fold protein